jgi:putative oxidoreductase
MLAKLLENTVGLCLLCAKNIDLSMEPSLNAFQRYTLAAARVLVAAIFLANGFGIIPQTLAAKDLAPHGTPAALVPVFMLVGRTIEIVGGFGLILGIYPRIAVIALIAFLVPATLMGHTFWQAAGTPAYFPQFLNFLKNTSMTGGLLFIAATSNQPTFRGQRTVNERGER